MIYFLNGVVDSKHLNSLVIDVNGIGYEVLVPTSVLSVVVHGEKRKLFTYQYVREDDLKLFGFLEAGDLEIFKLLISVNGIGPKAGLAILSGYPREDIVSAIQRADDRLFASVSGIGKKGAAKIVIELKGAAHFQEELVHNTSNDLIDALVGLGYSEKEIYSHLKQVDGTKDLNGQIKQMLGLLGK
jgi:holliday junction DNA helicase RuvA